MKKTLQNTQALLLFSLFFFFVKSSSANPILDNIPTTITSVSTSATDGPHGIGITLPISVTFSAPVTVTGLPRIALNSGGFATYTGGTGTTVLNFNYTISSGNNSTQLDYSSTTALTLNGGSINDENDVAASLGLPAPGGVGSLANGRSIVTNGKNPFALSIDRKTPVTQSTNANSVEYTITFSEPVTGVDILDFQMVPGSAAGTALSTVVGSGTTYTITLVTGIYNGPFAINLKSSGTGIANLALNPIKTGFGPSQIYTVDRVSPTISTATIASNRPDNPKIAIAGDIITVNFSASESILPVVTISGNTATLINTSGNSWTATYTMLATDNNGQIPFKISYSDFAGNEGPAVSTTNDASTVTYDKTPPVAPNFLGVTSGDKQNTMTWHLNADYAKYELIGGAPFALGNTVLTTITADDATNPMTFTQTGLTNLTTYYYALRVTDAAGNVNTSYTAVGTPINGQTITFEQPLAAEYGSSFTINATSSSGLPVTLTSNEPALATISGSTVTIVGVNSLQSVSIIATQPGDANYSNASPVIRLLQIKPKPVTVTAIAQTKVFGDSDPTIATPIISPALVGTDVNTGTLKRAAGENAGTYEIQQNTFNLDPLKYAVTYVPANLTISKRPITITPIQLNSKTYGDDDPTFAYTGSPALISGDAYTGKLGRIAGEAVGNYPLSLGDLRVSDNYTLTLNPDAALTINKKAIQVIAVAQSKVYGSADPLMTYNASPALVTGDDFSGALSRLEGEGVNTYIIEQGGLTLSSNYTLNYTPANLVIDPAPLTITADPKTKFAGTVNPVFTGQYVGFVNGEDKSVLSSPATFTSVATINSPIGTYPIVTLGAVAANYQITQVNGVLTIVAGAPTNVLFAGNTVYENQPSGTKAGTLSSTSNDPSTFTYTLVAGSGDTDNALFAINGSSINTTASLDFETKTSYSIRVKSTTQHGLSLEKTFNIALNDVNESPSLAAINDKATCYTTATQTIALTGISAGPEPAQTTALSVSSSNTSLFEILTVTGSGATGTLSYKVKAGASGTATVTVTVKDNGGVVNGGVDTYSRTFVITINPLPVVAVNSDKGTQVSKGEVLMLTASGGANYVWGADNSIQNGQNTATIVIRPAQTTTYTVTATNVSGCSETQSFTVTVLDDFVKVKATNIMSPNGDGINDYWIIDNLDMHPDNEVKIFNRSGRLVYSKKGYDNSWNATLNGAPLSAGTYYYIIDFGFIKPKVKGFITLTRQE